MQPITGQLVLLIVSFSFTLGLLSPLIFGDLKRQAEKSPQSK